MYRYGQKFYCQHCGCSAKKCHLFKSADLSKKVIIKTYFYLFKALYGDNAVIQDADGSELRRYYISLDDPVSLFVQFTTLF